MNKTIKFGPGDSSKWRTVVAYHHGGTRGKRYEFKCLHCGDIYFGAADALEKPCKKCSYYKDVPLQDLREQIYYKYRYNANLKGVPFQLAFDEFCKIISMNCLYCGKPPSGEWKSKRRSENSVTYNGIDRRTNSLGYVTGNVSPCCTKCNIAKKTFSVSEFKSMVSEWSKRMESW